MADVPASATRKHVVRTMHTGAKHLLSNFDSFHPPRPVEQEARHQPLKDADTPLHYAEYVSSTSTRPGWKRKDRSRVLQVDQLEPHMEICMAWGGETILEVTTFRKPAGTSIYLNINRTTRWDDEFESSTALYEPLLEAFEKDVDGEQWKTDILQIVHRADERAWWHVQQRIWRDKLRDPYAIGWKVRERVEKVESKTSATRTRTLPWSVNQEDTGQNRGTVGIITKRKLASSIDEQDQEMPAAKRPRHLPWSTDRVQKRRKVTVVKGKARAKTEHTWTRGVDTLSESVRQRGEVNPDDEEIVKEEGEHEASGDR